MPKGKGQRHAACSPQKTAIADRSLEIVALRIKGLSEYAIGEELGMPQPTVHHTLSRWMSKRLAEISDSVDELRQMESDRLDMLQAAVWDKALEGKESAIEVCLKVMRQRAALWGLNIEAKATKTVDNGVVFNIVLGGQQQLGQSEPITITATPPTTPAVPRQPVHNEAIPSPADPWES